MVCVNDEPEDEDIKVMICAISDLCWSADVCGSLDEDVDMRVDIKRVFSTPGIRGEGRVGSG